MTCTSFAGMQQTYIHHDTHQIWTALPTPTGKTVFAGASGFDFWVKVSFEVHGDE